MILTAIGRIVHEPKTPAQEKMHLRGATGFAGPLLSIMIDATFPFLQLIDWLCYCAYYKSLQRTV